MLILVLTAFIPKMVFASQKPEWRYENSIFVKVLAEETRTFSTEDFPEIDCKKVFVLSKYTVESEQDITYELVLMLDKNVKLEEAIEKVKLLPMVVEARRNEEYVMKDTVLTLNRSYFYLPVGGEENVMVKSVNFGRKAYEIYGIRFKVNPAYSEQITIEKDCFSKYGISSFSPEFQMESGDFLIYPFMQKEFESQKSESGVYHGLAGDENKYLFDTAARLAAAPEISYVFIVREFICGENDYKAVKTRDNFSADKKEIGLYSKSFDDVWNIDNQEIADYVVSGKLGKTLTVRGLTPGITKFTWERCQGDMYALNSCPIIVYESGSKNNPGDINHDGVISTDDALHVLKHIAGISSLGGEDAQKADLDGNKKVTMDDALLMLKITAGSL